MDFAAAERLCGGDGEGEKMRRKSGLRKRVKRRSLDHL